MLINEYNQNFNSEKVRKMRNFDNFQICVCSFVMSRTDALNGLDIHFKHLNAVLLSNIFPCVYVALFTSLNAASIILSELSHSVHTKVDPFKSNLFITNCIILTV